MMKSVISAAVLAGFLLVGDARAASAKHTYLVTTTHTPEQCLAALDEMAAKNKKMLSQVEWGCKGGDHTGYAFVEAADSKAALAGLPEANRATAKAVEVTKFTPDQLKKIHKDMGK